MEIKVTINIKDANLVEFRTAYEAVHYNNKSHPDGDHVAISIGNSYIIVPVATALRLEAAGVELAYLEIHKNIFLGKTQVVTIPVND